jgi:hypothetical protein
LNQSIFSKPKPRTRTAAVFQPQRQKAVRVLQCSKRATVTHQEYGKGLYQARTEDFGMEAAR